MDEPTEWLGAVARQVKQQREPVLGAVDRGLGALVLAQVVEVRPDRLGDCYARFRRARVCCGGFGELERRVDAINRTASSAASETDCNSVLGTMLVRPVDGPGVVVALHAVGERPPEWR